MLSQNTYTKFSKEEEENHEQIGHSLQLPATRSATKLFSSDHTIYIQSKTQQIITKRFGLLALRDNFSHEAFLRNARNSEETLRKVAIERTDISHLKGASKLTFWEAPTDSIYQVESTGAVVSLNSAVGLIHFCCSQLPSDRYSILRPEFIMEHHEKPGGPTEYSCRLQLPCNAPFEKLEGPVCSSMRLAQQAVCLDACKKLHQMGTFTDMLLPDKGSGGGVGES